MSECKCHRLLQERIILVYLVQIMLLVSCSSGKQETGDEMPLLYPYPLKAKFNPERGYAINPVTGDSIQSIVNSMGDTLKTGIDLQVIGHLIDPGILPKPVVVPAGTPEVVSIPQTKYKIPGDPAVIPLIKDSLRSYIPGKDIFIPSTLLNSTNYTIPTGVPVPVKGKVVPCRMPMPVEALRPRLRENAMIGVRYLDVEQGMNSSYVTAIMEDSKGNLWFCTKGGGVSRYNGVSFTHFTEKEGLPNNNITSILEDRHGNLWFGTEGGVCMYNGDSFIHFTENEGLGTNYIRALSEDRNGNIWFGTWGAGLVLFDGKTLTHFTENEGFINRNIRIMVKDIDNNIWIGTQGGVCMYNGTAFTHFTTEEGLIHPIIWSLEADDQGNVWIGSLAGGVSKYDGQSITNYAKNEGVSDYFIKSIKEDSNGNIWFGDVVGGVTKFDGKIFTYYGNEEGFETDEVFSIEEDSYGNLWFGTGGSGVNIYNPSSLAHYTRYEGYNKGITCILEDSQSNLWFGSRGGGLFRFDGEEFNRFTVYEGTGTNFIESMQQDRNGNLWLGHDGFGIDLFNGKSFTHFGHDWEHPLNHSYYTIEVDRHDNLWFGTSTNGVIMFDGELFTEFTEREGFIDNNIKSIIEDSHGYLWFGSLDAGVSRFNGQGFTNYSEREGLGDNCVWCMFEDSHGNLWLGTENGGANMISGDSITYFTEREGLSSNSIRSVMEDSIGNIWIGTMNGLNCLTFGNENDPGKGNRNWPVIHTYNEQDGLQGMYFNDEAVLLDSRNRLWWGTNRCLTMIDMNDFKLPSEVPSYMQLDRIEINGKFIDFRHPEEDINSKIQFSSVARFYNYPLNLKLPYKNNHLTFYYSAIDWSAPYKIKYSYRMDGLRANWSVPSEEAKAEYRNLPSGTFTFKVRAIGAAQKWSEPFEYTFTIYPPWWYSWWAFMIYGCLFILFMLQFRRSLLKRAKLKTAVEIERIEKEKVLELDQMKSRFFANISHEFRTPLTLILGPVEGLLKKKSKEIVVKSNELGIIHRNAKRLQQLINQLLDIAKLETGKVTLQVSAGNLTEHIRTIVLSYLSLAESKNIRYKYDLPDNPDKVYFDRDKLEKIVTNLISNAFKFTAHGGEVFVALKYIVAEAHDVAEFVNISIRDSGKGIPTDQIEKIFDRFYQVGSSDTREHEGTGIGLSLTRELIDIYRGEIKVESEPGKGSMFTVVLPVSREHFKSDEIVETVQDKSESIKYQPEDIIEDISVAEEINAEHASVKDSEHPVILIVEDNADLRKYISRNLKDEYQVLEAENGQNGLAVTINEIPDLVITDLMMPVMGGHELCKRIRQDQRTNHIPVIMLTAKADKESKLEGLSTGADDYLIKPFDADELNVRVKNLIVQRKKLREKFRKEFLMDPVATVMPPTEDEFLVRLLDCTRKHLEDSEFTVKQLGEELNLSHTQLYRKVLSLTDHTPIEYIRNYRLMTAARMFLEGHRNITSVLYTIGFNSPSYFTKSFRELFGISPSDYIKQRGGQNTKH
jgi:signal transduction histidine kinase/ligand-binding sensor domain-containing protein/DNA-binding response OmpR family regulator